jgi:hypothetical protein
MNAKYFFVSMACGAGWGLVAMGLGHNVFSRQTLLIGLAVSPLIGLVMGVATIPAYSLPVWARFLLLPVMVYVSAFLYGVAVSFNESSSTLEIALGVMAGTTGYILVLLPFAYFSHFGLGYLRTPSRR